MFAIKRLLDLRCGVLPALMALLITGCGGGSSGLDPILGNPEATALPRVTASTPVVSSPVATGVALNSVVSVAFSKDMAAASLNANSFTLRCPASTPVAGAIAYNATTRVATLTPQAALPPAAQCVATVTTEAKDSMGLALAAPFVLNFMTAPAPDLTAPTVVMTVPAAAATGVLNNTQITAVFSEDMRAASITASSFTLVNTSTGAAVPGTVSYSATGRTAVFTPAAPGTLAPSSRFTATVTTAAADLAGNTLAANFVWSFTTAALPDTTRPTVVLTAPGANATGVATNAAISATFSEDMSAASLSTTSFTLVNTTLGTAVSGSVSYAANGRTAVFTPSTPALLPANNAYTATITTAATDLAGNALASTFTWSFNTAAATDTTRPTVSAVVPAPNATLVPVNTAISVSFSEDMLPSSITGTSFSVINSSTGAPVAGTVSYSANARTALFTPSTPSTLSTNTRYQVTLTNVADLAGNTLAPSFIWAFTTAATPDAGRPTVIATVPVNTTQGVPTNTAISASFSEDMNPASLTGTSFTVVNITLGTPVSGTVSYSGSGRTAVFTPTNPATLAANTSFRATVTTDATDLAGNALATPFIWTFATTGTTDTTRPNVTAAVPAANATAVPNNSAVSVSFSEDMNPTSLSSSSFTLVNSTLGTAVAGTVSYSAPGRTAVFTPTNPATLAANTRFTATVSTTATDLAGNALAAAFVWSFTTAEIADSTRPTVVVTVPLPGATNVATNTQLTATFSEDMNPTSLSPLSFTLTNTSTNSAVAGNVSYSAAARTATFTVANAALLAGNSNFSARITAAATDLAGNALAGNAAQAPNAGDHVWTFSTAAQGDTVAPLITALSPQDASSANCLGTAVSATFNEAMDPNTVNGTSVTVTDGGAAVAGSVSYNAQSRVASFVPSAAAGFTANRSLVVTVKSGNAGVKDLAGNPLAADRVWSFSTGSQACLSAVNLRTAAAFGAFGGTAGVTNQGINTVVGGNLGSTAVCTAITGFHDASNVYTETPLNVGAVNGGVFCAPPAPGTASSMAIATQARADAETAYNELAALPPGSDPGAGQLGGRVLTGAVYTAAGGSFSITTGDLTLDGQGNPNAVWVFQSASALTLGQPALPRRVLLINGAQARNVFWQVGSAARIENGSTMVGTVIASAGVTISTAGQSAQTTLIGRAVSLIASVTMVNTTVVAP